MQGSACSVQHAVFSMQCSACSAQHVMFSMQCSACSVQHGCGTRLGRRVDCGRCEGLDRVWTLRWDWVLCALVWVGVGAPPYIGCSLHYMRTGAVLYTNRAVLYAHRAALYPHRAALYARTAALYAHRAVLYAHRAAPDCVICTQGLKLDYYKAGSSEVLPSFHPDHYKTGSSEVLPGLKLAYACIICPAHA